MKLLSAFLLALVFQAAVAQEKNYLQYHQQIIEAEEYFLNEDINKSLDKYQQVFKQYKPFAKDCFIALQLCCANNDTARAGYMALQCFERGISWKMLEQVTKIQIYLRAHPKHRADWEQMYKDKRNKYLSEIAWDVRAHVNALIQRDNVYKMIPYKAVTKDFHDSLLTAILDKNLLELIDIVKEKGIPGQQLIGVCDGELEKLGNDITMLHSSVDLIFFHHTYGYHLLKKDLMAAVIKGEILPKEYAMFHDWSYAYLKREAFLNNHPDTTLKHRHLTNIFKYSVTAPVEKQNKEYNMDINRRSQDTAFVNKCRQELAIASLEHDKRKKKYQAEKQLILFFGTFRNF